MADSEEIGGIKVTAEVSSAGLDTQLSSIEKKIVAAAEKMQRAATINFSATGPTGTGGGRPAKPPEPEPITFSGASSPTTQATGRSGAEQTGLQRYIAEAMAKEEAANQKTANTVTQAVSRQREATVERVQAIAPPPIEIPVEVAETPEIAAPQAPKPVTVPVEVAQTAEIAPPEAPAPVQIKVDDTAARQQLTDFLAFVKTTMSEANEAAVIRPQVEAPAQAPQAPQAAAPPPQQAPPEPEPVEIPPVVMAQTPQNDPFNQYLVARRQLLENRTDETVAAFEKARDRLATAQDEIVEAQEEPVAPPQAPPGGAGRNVPPFEAREDVNARRRQQGAAQLPPPPEEPPKPVVPPKPGTLYSAAPDEGAEGERQAKEARQRETVFNRREQTARAQQQRQDARDLARAEDADRAESARQQRQRELQELSFENQQREQERVTGGAGAAPPLPPDEQTRRQQGQANQRNQGAGAPPETPEERAARLARIADFHRRQEEAGRQDREEAARTMGGDGGGGRGGRPPTGGGADRGRGRGSAPPESMEEFIERIEARRQEAIQRTLSGITAGGRTGQVAASGISATAFGTRAQQIRATEEQRAARAIFGEAQKRLRFDPHDVEAAEAMENAAVRIADADKKLGSLQGFRATARNLLAISVGATVFSHAMSAAAPAIQAVAQAAGDWIDVQTGFVSKSTAVTTALSAQTHAQKGNVEAVLAQSAATAGLSKEASDYVTAQLQVTTQVKAGARAAQEASDLFRATMGLQGGQAPQGLYGGFGGLFGSSFLAQQMGGAKGFGESVWGDLKGIGKPKGGDIADILSGGVNFIGNDEIRNQLLENNKAAGANPIITGGFDIAGAVGAGVGGGARLTNDVLGALNPFGENFLDVNKSARQQKTDEAAAAAQAPEIEKRTQAITDTYLDSLTDAVRRGGGGGYKFEFTEDPAMRQRAAESAAGAGDVEGASAALKGFVITLNGDTVSVKQHSDAMTQAAIGMSRPDPQQLAQLALANERQRQVEARASVPAMREQFRYERPAVIAAANREQQFAQQVQIPAQAALANLANPLPPIGTGIVAANADEQERIRDATKETVGLQGKLNDYYEMGKQVLLDTYQIPPALINSIQQVGQQITSIQANIRNEQAAYQVAQYNYQLRIARRSLADIGGLTGRNFGAGQSYLGVLEKQNLALSRQAQLMQFAMQQRQINFQVALAGFEAPGVTPEERQARVKEAEIEAEFMQKQLNIQRQMFGNQVQIVDITNLRQGADLAAQINLLLQGRQLTIDTAVSEEKLLRLQKLQQEQLAQAGTYIEKVNKLTGRAFSEIQALETAAGEAMINASQYALDEFGITLDGMAEEFNSRIGTAVLTPSNNPTDSSSHRRAGAAMSGVEIEVKLNTASAQKQLEGINEQQVVIAENVGEYLGDVTRTVTRTSRQVNKLEGTVGDALGRATIAQVNALNTYFTEAAEMWTGFFAQVAQTGTQGGDQGGAAGSGSARRNAEGFVGMTTGTTMTGAGVMGEAGQEAYAILRNPKQLLDFGTGGGGGGNVTVIFNGEWSVRDESDIDKIAAKVMAATGREAALRGLRSVS